MHCRRGHMVVDWYQRLKALRPDIPEVSYIAGFPRLTPITIGRAISNLSLDV